MSLFGLTVTAQGDKITVSFAVYENVTNTYLYWEPEVEVENGETALEILELSGLEYKASNGYVSEIAGYKEFGHGKKSGWMYSVNGVKPNISAARYTLKDGDKLVWFYVTDYTAQATTKATQPPIHSEKNETVTNNTNANADQNPTANNMSASVASSANASQTNASSVTATLATNEDFAVETGQSVTERSISHEQSDMISNSLSFLKLNSGNFTPLVLSLYNQAIGNSLKNKLVDEVKNSENIEPIACERLIINLSAIGYDVTNIDGVNLSELLLDSKGIMKTGLNGAIFGLLAYSHCTVDESKTYENNVDSLIQNIIQNQNEDGGFSLTYGEKSDVDITAMALSALSAYKSQSNVSGVIEKALLWLLNNQNDDGSFTNSYGEVNSESTSQVIIALCSLGLGVEDERFVKDANPYQALTKFYTKTAFSHTLGGDDDTIATEQALLAIYAYNYSKNPYTETVTNHIDEVNLRLFAMIAVGIVIVCLIVLYILKKKGIIAAAMNEKAKADEINDRLEKERSSQKKKNKHKSGE